MPYCVRSFRIRDDEGRLVFEERANHQARRTIRLDESLLTKELTIELDAPLENVPASLFEVRGYGPDVAR